MTHQPRAEPKTHTAHSSTSSSIASELSIAPLNSNLKLVPCAQPPPAYVALAAASQLVTDNHTPLPDLENNNYSSPTYAGGNETALFSPGGLAMINGFLDQIFFNFLVHAQASSLAAIQTAVEHVLKGKLAKHAIASADEELEELLSDDVDEDLVAAQENGPAHSKMDVEAVFWRTRLRVMVYMRLGEMEDEDEERYVEQGQAKLNTASARKRLSLTTGLVSWAAAIYLTSILEFIAEQCLSVAGGAAFDRVAARRRSKTSSHQEGDDRVVVEEYDVERIALSSTLGRLWRTWRKQTRTPHSRNVSAATSRSSSMKPFSSAGTQRTREKTSACMAPQDSHQPDVDQVLRSSIASEEGTRVNTARIYRLSQRPRSLMVARRINSLDDGLRKLSSPIQEQLSSASRRRSNSVPTHSQTLLASPLDPRPSTSGKSNSVMKPTDKVLADPDEGRSQVHIVPCGENSEEVLKSGTGTAEDEVMIETHLGKSDRLREEASDTPGRRSPQSLLDRAAATRQASPAAVPKDPSRADVKAMEPTKPSAPSSAESLTSIDEGSESLRSVSSINALPDALGIHGSMSARTMPVATTGQLRSRQIESSKSSFREPMLRAVQSFEREERSSVRRLSEASSKHSKSGVPSQEVTGTPYQSGGQSDHYKKDFQDFMAGQATVKYTLTPKTLQDIESPDSSRYKNDEAVPRPAERRQRQISSEEFVSVQQAVIAKMNASLKSYGIGSERQGAPPAKATSNKSVSGGEVGGSSQSNGHMGGVEGEGGAWTMGRGTERWGIVEPKQTYSGWTSTRTSTDSPRRSGVNGSSQHQWPATVSSARKTSTSTLEPRDAGKTGLNKRGETEDLVTFLRSTGPPNGYAGLATQTGVGNYGRQVEGHTTLPMANRASSSKSPSVNGSVNSHTGLLVNGSRSPMMTRTVQSGSHNATAPTLGREDGPGLRRTRRRIKDPYALPSDDEDEDELTALPSQGETLIDFLRNVEPPPQMIHGGKEARGTATSSVGDRQMRAGHLDSPGDSLQERAIKNKGSVKSLWKKINS